jgi:hypothetical protein
LSLAHSTPPDRRPALPFAGAPVSLSRDVGGPGRSCAT